MAHPSALSIQRAAASLAQRLSQLGNSSVAVGPHCRAREVEVPRGFSFRLAVIEEAVDHFPFPFGEELQRERDVGPFYRWTIGQAFQFARVKQPQPLPRASPVDPQAFSLENYLVEF